MTDFIIHQRPVSISFECPFCECSAELAWCTINTPDYWGDKWDDVECPHCKNKVSLGDYELD